jgi:hypothetical protein
LCGLTFELSGPETAWPARRMMTASVSRAKCHSGASPLERRVRPHCPSLAKDYWIEPPQSEVQGGSETDPR